MRSIGRLAASSRSGADTADTAQDRRSRRGDDRGPARGDGDDRGLGDDDPAAPAARSLAGRPGRDGEPVHVDQEACRARRRPSPAPPARPASPARAAATRSPAAAGRAGWRARSARTDRPPATSRPGPPRRCRRPARGPRRPRRRPPARRCPAPGAAAPGRSPRPRRTPRRRRTPGGQGADVPVDADRAARPRTAPASSRPTARSCRSHEPARAANHPPSTATAGGREHTPQQHGIGARARFVSGARVLGAGFADDGGPRWTVVCATSTSPVSTPPSTSAASGGQRLAELGADQRDRSEAGLGGVLAGDVGGGGPGRNHEVERAERSVHGEGEAARAFRPTRLGHVRQGSRSLPPGGRPPIIERPGTTRIDLGKGARVSTTLRGGRLDQPEMPTGEIVLQAPPQLQQHEGAGGVLMNAIPMLGSLGSIVLVASMGGRRAAAAATSPPACSSSPRSASSSSRSTGSGSSAPSR